MRVQRAGPRSRLNGAQTQIWKRLDFKISFPRRQQRLVWRIFSAGQWFGSPGDPRFAQKRGRARSFFFRLTTRQPFKWLDPRLPFYKACSPDSSVPAGPHGALPGRNARLAGLCRRVWKGEGRSGRRLPRRLIHKSPLTFSASPFMTAAPVSSSSACSPTSCPTGKLIKRLRPGLPEGPGVK